VRAFKLDNGNLLVPMTAVSDDGMPGDGMVEVELGTREYDDWISFAEPVPPDFACFAC
jgi:hypothetical protein